MQLDRISNLIVTGRLRESIRTLEDGVAATTLEISTGRYADVGLKLGHETSRAVGFRNEIGHLSGLLRGNQFARTKAEATNAALQGISELGQNLLNQLVASDGSAAQRAILVSASQRSFEQLQVLLNTSFDGQYLFGGLRTGQEPLQGVSLNDLVKEVFQTFEGKFGFTPDDPAAATLAAADVKSFVDVEFGQLYAASAWSARLADGTGILPLHRISDQEMVATTVSPTVDGLRNLMKSIVLTASFAGSELKLEAFTEANVEAGRATGNAIANLSFEQSRLGIAMNEIGNAIDRQERSIDTLRAAIAERESINVYDAQTRVNALMTTLEASYSLSARLSRLSLLNFI